MVRCLTALIINSPPLTTVLLLPSVVSVGLAMEGLSNGLYPISQVCLNITSTIIIHHLALPNGPAMSVCTLPCSHPQFSWAAIRTSGNHPNCYIVYWYWMRWVTASWCQQKQHVLMPSGEPIQGQDKFNQRLEKLFGQLVHAGFSITINHSSPTALCFEASYCRRVMTLFTPHYDD